jgi:sulfonate dioxygenase
MPFLEPNFSIRMSLTRSSPLELLSSSSTSLLKSETIPSGLLGRCILGAKRSQLTSRYALYSSLSRPYQKYLESLYAVHTGFNQSLSRTGEVKTPRRQPIETIHPVVRVHPVFVSRIVGVPKAESDATLEFLKNSFAQQTDATIRWRWETGDVALWDNRMVNHSATFDAYPSSRHGLRVTPHAEKPLSVEDYESQYGLKAKDWIQERYKNLGIEAPAIDDGSSRAKAFRD